MPFCPGGPGVLNAAALYGANGCLLADAMAGPTTLDAGVAKTFARSLSAPALPWAPSDAAEVWPVARPKSRRGDFMITQRTRRGFLDGGGRMGALMRTHDWSRSPLGPPACWPDTLKAAIGTCLASRFPMVVWWGPDLAMLYNDAWRPILGETKHPAGLGRSAAEVWPETWPIVRGQFESALNGKASWSENLLLASDRHGFLEESYFTYSHSPLKDAEGKVVGVLTAVIETTDRVLSERRMLILRALSKATVEVPSQCKSVEHACQALLDLLCKGNPDVPLAALYVCEDGTRARLICSGGIDRSQLPSTINAYDNDPWGISRVLCEGAPAFSEHPKSMSQPLPGG